MSDCEAVQEAPKVRRLPLLTTSAIRTWKSCHRLYLYKYVQGYRAIQEGGALKFGKLVHLALEAWWRATPDMRLQSALDIITIDEADPYERARARAAMRGYNARWADQTLTGHVVEAEFVTELVNPDTRAPSKTWSLAGKLDVIATDEKGHRWLVEHKTTTQDISPGSTYWRHLRLDSQVSNYFVGARSLGIELDGCIYDVIKRPMQRPKLATPVEERRYVTDKATKQQRLDARQRDTDETPEEFEARICEDLSGKPDEVYLRGEVVRLEEEEREAAADAWAAGREIREAELAKRYPRNDDACERWGRACEFLEVCERSASLDDVTRFRRAERAHEELSAPAAAE